LSKTRVLFIGNSYTQCNRLPKVLEDLVCASDAAANFSTQMVATGGWTLEQHWHDTRSRPLLKKDAWEYVVLQEQTRRPYEDTAKYHEYVRKFDQEIRACGAKTVLYLTWAPGPEPERQAELNAAIGGIGREIEAIVVPSGLAFEIVRREASQIELFVEDHRHPSPQGTYLSACVFFSVLRGRSPLGLAAASFNGADESASRVTLPSDVARTLQSAAWRASRPAH
jgi:hypothetical protein